VINTLAISGGGVVTLLERAFAVPVSLQHTAIRTSAPSPALVLKYGVDGRGADQGLGAALLPGREGIRDGKPQGGG
jgi:hypothetical protein